MQTNMLLCVRNKRKLLCALFTCTVFTVITSTQIYASSEIVKKALDIPPVTAASAETPIPSDKDITDPPLHLTPDKSELIKFEQDIGMVVVGNPAHANVLADTTRTLVVIPRLPGATYFTVLNNKGEILMQRHILIAGPEENYVRIKKTCAGDDDNCQTTSVFYCPDTCHTVRVMTEKASKEDSSSKSTSDQTNKDAEDNALSEVEEETSSE